MLDVDVCWILQIQSDIASESTDGEIRWMYKAVKKTKVIQRYMEALALQTGATEVHLEETTLCISIVEAEIVTPGVKKIDIPVWFVQEIFDNGLFIPKYEKSSVITEDMFDKPCSGQIISRSNK